MRHRVAGRTLGRQSGHRKALYRNLVTDLLHHERITTTEAKAKEIRPMAEKIITLGRRGDLHSRRQALRVVYDEKVVKKVFDDIGPRMKERPGGYLRITALEPRKGDGAAMASIELVDYVEAPPTERPQRVTAAPTAAPAAAGTAAGVTAEGTDESSVEASADEPGAVTAEPAGTEDVAVDGEAAAEEEPRAEVEAEEAGEAADTEDDDADETPADTAAEADGDGEDEKQS